jgi:hypothetical protein
MLIDEVKKFAAAEAGRAGRERSRGINAASAEGLTPLIRQKGKER